MLLPALSVSAFAGSVHSNVSSDTLSQGIYVGADAGYAKMDYKKAPLMTSVENAGFTGRIFGGYQYNQYVAAEMGYMYLPEVKGEYGGIANVTFNQQIIDLMVKGMYPVGNDIDLVGKAGYAAVFRSEEDGHVADFTVRLHNGDTKYVPVLGGGADYHITKNVIADVTYLHYFKNGDLPATDFGGAGVSYLFG